MHTELYLQMGHWPMSLCVARLNKARERLHDVLSSKGLAICVCLGGVLRGLADYSQQFR